MATVNRAIVISSNISASAQVDGTDTTEDIYTVPANSYAIVQAVITFVSGTVNSLDIVAGAAPVTSGSILYRFTSPTITSSASVPIYLGPGQTVSLYGIGSSPWTIRVKLIGVLFANSS